MWRLRPQIFFSSIVATLDASHWTGFDRLTIEHSGTGLRLTPHLASDLFAQGGHDLFPQALLAPETEVMIDRLAVGQIMGHLSPGTACTHQVEDAVDDFPPVYDRWRCVWRRLGDHWLQVGPLRVGQIRRVASSKPGLIHLGISLFVSLACRFDFLSFFYRLLSLTQTHSESKVLCMLRDRKPVFAKQRRNVLCV